MLPVFLRLFISIANNNFLFFFVMVPTMFIYVVYIYAQKILRANKVFLNLDLSILHCKWLTIE